MLSCQCLAIEGEEDAVGDLEGKISEVEVPALPEWGEFDAKIIEAIGRPFNLGGGLWPDGQVPLEEEDTESLGIQIPGAEPDVKAVEPAPYRPPEPIPATFVPLYFGDRPDSYLVDPQGLVAPEMKASIERFLAYHADESETVAYVLVMDRHHELPVEVSTKEIWSRWFPEGLGAIVLYQLGQPENTAIEFGPDLASLAGVPRLQQLLDACVRDALEVGDLGGQLDRFCVRFSVELYWLEGAPPGALIEEEGIVVSTDEKTVSAKRWYVIAGLGAGISMLVAALLIAWHRRPVRLPAIPVGMRMGGHHSGGHGASSNFLRGESDT